MNPISLPKNASSGAMSINDVGELRKALTAGYGTDVSALTGGAALRIQSLEKTMLSTIQENKHFALFNELEKSDAVATVDEWTEQSGIGGFLGGSTNSETGVIPQATGIYDRRVGMVKYLMTMRQVSFVQTLQSAIAESEAIEQMNGALQLLTDAEYLSFEGDATVVPTEFDGILAQVQSLESGGNRILDARGKSLASINLVNNAAAIISGYGNFGTPTHMFMSQLTQADFDTGLGPAFRVPLTEVPGGGIQIGAPVVGIRTSHGNIKTIPDVFIRDEAQMAPFEVEFPLVATANNTFQPASATPVAAVGTASQFETSHGGNYYYGVAGVNAAGQSQVVVTAQAAVATGDKVTLTIAQSTGKTETGYVIYRGRKNGTNAVTDLRQLTRIPAAGATTVFVDNNQSIPGTSKAYILNMLSGAKAITWRQLLPMLKFPLYPTNAAVVPWAQLLFGFLRIGKRNQHSVITNVLPDGAVWRPFG